MTGRTNAASGEAVAVWKAYIKVHSCDGATVTAVGNGRTISSVAPATGIVTLAVLEAGTYTVTATYGSVVETDTIAVENQEEIYETYLINRTYLYKEGDEFFAFTGGWDVTDTGTVIKNADNMEFYSSGSTTRALLATVRPVDLTDVSTISFYGGFPTTSGSATVTYVVASERQTSDFAATVAAPRGTTERWTSLSVAGLSGNYYIGEITTAYSNRPMIREVYMA